MQLSNKKEILNRMFIVIMLAMFTLVHGSCVFKIYRAAISEMYSVAVSIVK